MLTSTNISMTLGDDSYFPPGATHESVNRLFAMFHAQTEDRIKKHVLSSMVIPEGTVRVVFATVALGMGVHLVDVYQVIHYGAPSSIDDYFQESGRSGRSGDQAKSIVLWKPADAPLKQDLANPRNADFAAVRRYLENDSYCRRYQLLRYFDPNLPNSVPRRDPLLCCDVCAKYALDQNMLKETVDI